MFRTFFPALILWLGVFSIKALAITNLDSEGKISDYKTIFLPFYDSNHQLKIALRTYIQSATRHFIIVDPYNLNTQILATEQIRTDKIPSELLNSTPYIKALRRYTDPPYKLQDYGATAALYNSAGVFLTIDLCPSTKHFEWAFFKKLSNLTAKNKTITPIAISISGLWATKHSKEFAWLKNQLLLKKLNITWINHSFSHPYIPSRPYEKNFLLMNKENFEQEIFKLEKLLLENELVPSVFVRFPGLISDENLIKKLKKMSLIPIGSNAWLAKGEAITPGAFILVHGNGGEPEGVKVITPLLPSLHLLPIQAAFIPVK